MSKSNNITLRGTIGRVQIHDTDGGGKFLAISLAVNEGFKRADGTFGRKQTQWHQVVSFSKTKAQLVADSVSVGDLVEIQGELRGRVIEIGERKITTSQVVLTEIERIAGKAGQQAGVAA